MCARNIELKYFRNLNQRKIRVQKVYLTFVFNGSIEAVVETIALEVNVFFRRHRGKEWITGQIVTENRINPLIEERQLMSCKM